MGEELWVLELPVWDELKVLRSATLMYRILYHMSCNLIYTPSRRVLTDVRVELSSTVCLSRFELCSIAVSLRTATAATEWVG